MDETSLWKIQGDIFTGTDPYTHYPSGSLLFAYTAHTLLNTLLNPHRGSHRRIAMLGGGNLSPCKNLSVVEVFKVQIMPK